MNQQDFQELLRDEHFSPFTVTTHGGFILAINEHERRHTVAGRNMFVTLDSAGRLIHIPYKSIGSLTLASPH